MMRNVIAGFTPMLVDRLLECVGGGDYSKVLVVLNLDDQALVEAVHAAGLRCTSLGQYQPGTDDRLLLGVLRPESKRRVVADFNKLFPDGDAPFEGAVHPFSSLSRSATLARGVLVEPGTVIAPHAHVGHFVSINRNCSVGHHTHIGDWAMINPGVNIAGTCSVGEGVSIGIGTNVFDGVTIGDGSIIGGGSVVTRNVPPGVLAFGNPCKVVREL